MYYPHTHMATQIPNEKQKELKRREIKLDISCHNGRGEGRGRESTLDPLHATVAALMLALLDYPHKCWCKICV